MLDTTLTTEFIPGTNIKGEVAGANWAFLLPSLELERIVCLGALPQARLISLAHLAGELVVICADQRAAQAIDAIGQQQGLANLRAIGFGGAAALPDASVTLAISASAGETRRLSRDHALQSELRRILRPNGMLYFEQRGLRDDALLRGLANAFGVPQRFWLTPNGGEMHTAVPAQDQATTRYFLRNSLTSRSLDLGLLKRAVRGLKPQRARQAAAPIRMKTTVPSASNPARGGMKARVKRLARTTLAGLYQGVQSTLDRAENSLNGNRLGRFTGRYGTLIARGAQQASRQPPAYLRAIAADAGVPLEQYRWGLSARGEYRSRKVLFFLFNRAAEAPEYIIKMTRDPALNPRLENEYRALVQLEERGIGDRETLPRAIFCGHHKQLAIVGETIVDGVPFEQRSDASTSCPHAHAAIEWLTKLGAQTADRSAASSLDVSEALGGLFTRFSEIYQLTPTQHDFMAEQIAVIARSRDAFPLVFQHGDPGTWNIWVTPAQRVAFLDWEAAEPAGMPLWDLFYFVRTYGAWSKRAAAAGDIMKGFAEQFLSRSPWQKLLIDATARYCAELGVPGQLIEPLFYTCWMHRALKESTRLTADTIERGHYANLLRASIDRRAVLAGLFSLQTSS